MDFLKFCPTPADNTFLLSTPGQTIFAILNVEHHTLLYDTIRYYYMILLYDIHYPEFTREVKQATCNLI